jgi:hypothetical protein
MTTKTAKVSKPKIRVEEIVEEKPIPKQDPVKIASFSQLDTDTPVAPKKEALIPPTEVDEPVPDASEPPAPVHTGTLETPEPEQTEALPDENLSSDDVKEWLKDIRPDTTKEVEKSGGFDFKLFFGFLVLFALIGALIGGLYYYKQRVGNLSNTNTEEETQPAESETPSPEPTMTPAPAVDVSKLKVSVLNGSGISGEAGKVENLLVAGGFSKDLVATGNASAFNHKTTSVSLKKTVPAEVFDKIKTALGSGYEVIKAVGDLSDTSANDIEITVGKKE